MLKLVDERGLGGRVAVHAALALGIAALAGAFDARAAAGGPWCANTQGPDGGYVVCNYSTWQQCTAAVRGVGGICHLDPALWLHSERGWRKRSGH